MISVHAIGHSKSSFAWLDGQPKLSVAQRDRRVVGGVSEFRTTACHARLRRLRPRLDGGRHRSPRLYINGSSLVPISARLPKRVPAGSEQESYDEASRYSNPAKNSHISP